MGGYIISPRDAYILPPTTASGAGSAFDMRGCLNFAFMVYGSYAPSSILKLQASHDSTGWLDVMTVTGITTSGSAQISAFFPYVRGVMVTGYSTTGSGWIYYAPGNR